MVRSMISQSDLIMEFFKNNPLRDIQHPEVVDWLTTEYKKRTGKTFRDPDRGIRKLAQQGKLIKVGKGVYRYDPDYEHNRELEDFTEGQKETIKKRDGYKCVICGKGKKDGVEIHIDHIKPKDLGGKAEIENGQVLCATHNFRKKNMGQTETGKKMFMALYNQAKKSDDHKLMAFIDDVMDVYDKHDINGHIRWDKHK